MTGDEPPYLAVGTEVSAKYRGAFCEAKVKKLVRSVKCKVVLKDSQIPMMVTDDQLKGILKVGEVVELKDPDSGQIVQGTISKLTDSSMYTVVFDDGDERTLRRSQLCLKGEKHFIESETLDNLPLSHPEHFGTPVMHGKKAKRGRYSGGTEDELDETSSEDGIPKRASYKGRLQDLVGKVMVLEVGDKKKQHAPILVVLPDAQPPDPKKRDHILVRSFKDGKFIYAQRKELKEFTRDVALKNEDKALKPAMEKALLYFDNQDLPPSWDHDELLGTDDDEDFNEEESSDDEPSEDKDCFVAQLYKFMDDRGTPINKAPAIVNKDLNLYRLFKVVQNLGGYNKVTNQMKWRMVYAKMNLPLVNTASHQIKNAYKKYLHAFEDFYRKLGSSMGTISRPGRSRHNSGRGMVQFRGKEKESDKKDEKEPENISEETKEDKEEDVSPVKDRATPKRVTRQDLSEEGMKKEPQADTKKVIKKEETEEAKKKGTKKEENENKKDAEVKKNQKKEELEAKKVKDEDVKKGKEENETKKEKSDKNIKKDDDKKGVKKEEGGNKKSVKNDEGKKEKKEEILPKKAKVVVKKEKDEPKIKNEIENDLNEKKTPQQAVDKKTPVQTIEKKTPQNTDKKTVPQTIDKSVSPAVEKKSAQQTGDKKLPLQLEDKPKPTPPSAAVDDDSANASPKKLIRRRSMRKDEVKEEINMDPTVKIVMQKEVKVQLIKKDIKQDVKQDLKQEVIKRIKKAKVESQTEVKKSMVEAPKKDVRNCPLGTRLKVKYGGGKTEKIYDAKVVETKTDDTGLSYLVHYAGWNNRYDEWIQPERIVSIVEKPSPGSLKKKQKDGNSPKPSKPPSTPSLTPQQQVLKKRARSGPGDSPSSSPARSEKARSPSSSVTSTDRKRSRPTRSNSVEFKVIDGLPAKGKRTRKNSGLTETSDIISHASFTDDTDNSDEEAEKTDEMDFSDSQSFTEQPKIMPSEIECKSKEEAITDEPHVEKETVDVVEVKVLYESSSSIDSVDLEVKTVTTDSDIIAAIKIETESENKVEECKSLELPVEDIKEKVKNDEVVDVEIKMPEIQEIKMVAIEIVPELKEDKHEAVEEVSKEVTDTAEIKEEATTKDRFEFKDEEEEISLPEWKAERHVDEDWKPKPEREEKRGRPRKSQNKDKIETKKEQTPKEKKEVKKVKMTMAERKYMGQNLPQMVEMEPSFTKVKEEDFLEKQDVKDKETNDEDTEEDIEMEKKKVKKKKKKENLDSDSSDIDHKKAIRKDNKTPNKPVSKSKKRLKDSDDPEKRSLMSDDDSSVTSEKCDTDNPSVSSETTSNSVIANEPKISADTIEISEQTETATGAFENTPPTSPEQEMDACVNISPNHSQDSHKKSHDSHKNIVTSTEQQFESPVGNASPSSNDGSVGSGNVAGSDSSDMANLGKRRKESDEGSPAKKKKRGKSKSIGERKSKPNGSDSDEGFNQSSQSGTSSPSKSRPRSPRTPKYNLNLEEGKYLEGEQRISFLMEKVHEIRKIYMDLKSEVALIDRRRKRAKRKERDSSHAAESESV